MIYNVYDENMTVRDKEAGFEVNGLFELPSFVNVNEGDFTLDANSPGIGAAVRLDNFCEGTEDRLPDMGAHQSYS